MSKEAKGVNPLTKALISYRKEHGAPPGLNYSAGLGRWEGIKGPPCKPQSTSTKIK